MVIFGSTLDTITAFAGLKKRNVLHHTSYSSRMGKVTSNTILSWKHLQHLPSTYVTAAPTRRLSIRHQEDESERAKLKLGNAKIAVIGGGICGVTAASAIKHRMLSIAPDHKIEIIIYERDEAAFSTETLNQSNMKHLLQPTWTAATARNCNSLVPGGAMHIMSQRSTLADIARDTASELYLSLISGNADKRDFSDSPPYFGVNLNRCLGMNVSNNERKCFASFIMHFMKTCLITGSKEAEERGHIMVQLAKANKCAFENYLTMYGKESSKNIGLRQGFVSVFRSQKGATNALKEGKDFGVEMKQLSIAEAVDIEPKIANLPIQNMHFVYRIKDQTADCAEFIRTMINSFHEDPDITYANSNMAVKRVSKLKRDRSKGKESLHRFKVELSDGSSDEFDYVVLAAGVYTPLFAHQLGNSLASVVPIYPLRGYSLTAFVDKKSESPYLQTGLSFDGMYCSSVSPHMVRLAGFGEIAGFPDYDKSSCSKVGPMVLEKYANAVFGSDLVKEVKGTTLPCYRPMSPDDFPIVGGTAKMPRVYFHTGHGTLGWTMAMATAHCLAQDICDDILGVQDRDDFVLPDGTSLDRSTLSPDRFSFI